MCSKTFKNEKNAEFWYCICFNEVLYRTVKKRRQNRRRGRKSDISGEKIREIKKSLPQMIQSV